MRQHRPTGCLRLRKLDANAGSIFIAQWYTVEWSTKTPFLMHYFFYMLQAQRIG